MSKDARWRAEQLVNGDMQDIAQAQVCATLAVADEIANLREALAPTPPPFDRGIRAAPKGGGNGTHVEGVLGGP